MYAQQILVQANYFLKEKKNDFTISEYKRLKEKKKKFLFA